MKLTARPLGYPEGLALLRVGFGCYFWSEGFDKLTKGWLVSGEPLLSRLTGPQGTLTRGTGEAAYRPFLENVVAPNVDLFSRLVTVGELTAGTLLILGLLTRLGAFTGMLLNLNYMLMKGLPNTVGNSDRLFFLAGIVFAVTAAGLVWGLDGVLRNQLAATPITRWLAGLPTRDLARRR